jgi:hypothetical protein
MPADAEDMETVVMYIRAATTELAQRLHMGQEWLQELLDALRELKQTRSSVSSRGCRTQTCR